MKLSRNFTSIECIIFTQLLRNSFENTKLIQNNSNLFDVKDIILDFKLNIISSKLSKTTHYNSYQQNYIFTKKQHEKYIINIIIKCVIHWM